MRKTFQTIAILSVGIVAMIAGGYRLLEETASAQAVTQIPKFRAEGSWPKLPSKWIMAIVSSTWIDEQDHLWVLQRPNTLSAEEKPKAAPPVLEFDAEGNFIQAWGGPGAGYDWPETEHGIYIDPKGFVWIGGNGNDDQILKFTKAGKFVMQIGKGGQKKTNADTKNLWEPADVFVYAKTNELFVADGYGNKRIIVFDADTGAFKRMWGAFGNVPTDRAPAPLRPGITGLAMPAPPLSTATAPPRAGGAPPEAAAPKSAPGPQQFGDPVHSVKVSNDELVYVADRTNSRVQVFTLDGKYVNQLFTGGSPGGLALSPDPQQQFLYIGDGARILVVDRKTLKVLSDDRFGKRGSVSTHLLAVDSKGNIYTTELDRGTQKFISVSR